MTMTDDHALTQLVRRCQQGDLEAFAALFRHFRQYVYDLACVILRDNVAAHDAVQGYLPARHGKDRYLCGRGGV
jgi:DNA-directed RNA polymerase specialized sigma24 family protein